MNRLRSTGVFFTAPPPVAGLPLLPGRLVETVTIRTSLQRETSPDPSLMVGEFVDENGADYAMCVNLSLAHSINIKPELHGEGTLTLISAVDHRRIPYDSENGHWLVPGQGVLFQITLQDLQSGKSSP